MVPIIAVAEVEMGQRESLLPVFLDCDNCDFDFIRRQILFVDWVRDIADAEIHVQIITHLRPAPGRFDHPAPYAGGPLTRVLVVHSAWSFAATAIIRR